MHHLRRITRVQLLQMRHNPYLHGRGTTVYHNHSFEWPFLLKFLCTKIVSQCVFLVQSIVFLHTFLNLWNNNAFISFYCKYIFFSLELSIIYDTQGPRKIGIGLRRIQCVWLLRMCHLRIQRFRPLHMRHFRGIPHVWLLRMRHSCPRLPLVICSLH